MENVNVEHFLLPLLKHAWFFSLFPVTLLSQLLVKSVLCVCVCVCVCVYYGSKNVHNQAKWWTLITFLSHALLLFLQFLALLLYLLAQCFLFLSVKSFTESSSAV